MMKKNRRSRKKSFKKRVFSYVMITFTCIFMVSVILTLPLRWLNPFTTTFIIQEMVTDKKIISLDWVPYNRMAKTLPVSVVASEDQKFPDHYGFDFDSLYKALTEKRKQTRGASTISQQLVKNMYLWSGRSLIRKGLEAYFTILIEAFLPKRRILEIYLNVVEFAPAVYGVGAASRQLFNRSPENITAYQASLLAAVLPNPKLMSAANPSFYVRKRAAQIRESVRSLGGAAYLKRL
ncbi:monofunctional biosynthetic peptidoglycan transglycosylase [Moritella sp. F3]|uniref:monofunctional biosynthetic peptidoglycan transglycosylase n=1 Tax=Moritella sp. F3 TaxID=2718882 RepID=UPI001F5491E1|nr:monofunctional biosynthetic peptidoglycan transglycosylase [Moritella sp. F3]